MSDHAAPSNPVAASFALLAATLAALIVANSALAEIYKHALYAPLGGAIGPFDFVLSLKDWIKSALMAVFFLFVGLEIKVEFKEGALAEPSRAILPFAGAIGGMAAPALIYLALTASTPELTRGWAIPSATDIAFAIGVVGLLGRRVPSSLRAFLLAVAVIDDLGAILVIALFYTGALKLWALAGMAIAILALALLNLRGVKRLWPYLVLGFVLWAFTLQSGVNATLAGVVTALFVPLGTAKESPLHALADKLELPVNFAIMPIFAFANAGVPILSLGLSDLGAPLTLAIVAGLAIGKPLGITLLLFLAVRLGLARLPFGSNWRQIIGIACLAGIGFTMSLFIGALAFDSDAAMNQVRLGVLAGSLVSGMAGAALLTAAARNPAEG